jgi:hypothetical protein
LKRIEYDLSSASTIRYRRAEVLAKVLLSIDIFKYLNRSVDNEKYRSREKSVELLRSEKLFKMWKFTIFIFLVLFSVIVMAQQDQTQQRTPRPNRWLGNSQT